MSEYCHHCGTTISEDIATLCPLCASRPATVRREEIDEFAAKLTSADARDEIQRLRAALRECLDGIDYTVRVDAILRPEERHSGLEKLGRHRSLLPNAQSLPPADTTRNDQ